MVTSLLNRRLVCRMMALLTVMGAIATLLPTPRAESETSINNIQSAPNANLVNEFLVKQKSW